MSQVIFQTDFTKHPLHYFTLFCIQIAGLWGLLWFSHQPTSQLVVLVSMSVSYVIWGIVHHYEHQDLHIKIVIEYILVATLATLIIGSLVLRT